MLVNIFIELVLLGSEKVALLERQTETFYNTIVVATVNPLTVYITLHCVLNRN